MTGYSNTLLTAIIAYGPPLVGLCLLMGGAGIPLPTTLIVLASGAFIRQGLLSPQAALIGFGCVMAGDSLSFGMGRLGRGWLCQRFGATAAWQNARKQFERQGGIAIYLTRWLLTGIAIPVNLVAGGSGYRFNRFLLFDLVGETTWFIVFGGLGYELGSQWQQAQNALSNLSGTTVGLALAGMIAVWGMREARRRVRPELHQQNMTLATWSKRLFLYRL